MCCTVSGVKLLNNWKSISPSLVTIFSTWFVWGSTVAVRLLPVGSSLLDVVTA